MKHPYMMRCVGECGSFTQHVERSHSSGEKLWCCTKCGAWTLAKPTRKKVNGKPLKNPDEKVEYRGWTLTPLFDTQHQRTVWKITKGFATSRPMARSLESAKKRVDALEPKKNPIADDVQAARRLGREFSGHDPRRAARVQLRKPRSKVRLAVGEVTAIQYRARRDGRTDEYRHRFAKGSRPQLAVTPDGNHLELLGGAFRFTDRGIVDKRR